MAVFGVKVQLQSSKGQSGFFLTKKEQFAVYFMTFFYCPIYISSPLSTSSRYSLTEKPLRSDLQIQTDISTAYDKGIDGSHIALSRRWVTGSLFDALWREKNSVFQNRFNVQWLTIDWKMDTWIFSFKYFVTVLQLPI